jgi:hypothetical protein
MLSSQAVREDVMMRFLLRAAVRLAPLSAAALFALQVHADNFSKVYYDKKTNQLVVTMSYRGTNPDHDFTLKWGECELSPSGDLPGVTAEVLDDQWQDQAQQSYKKTTRFDLGEMPCNRPAVVTLRSAPRFFYSLTIAAR